MLNAEQQNVFNACVNASASSIILIQGKAGTGKSYLIRELSKVLPYTQVLTPTNMARSVYGNAMTYHSFFWGELDDMIEEYQDAVNYHLHGEHSRCAEYIRRTNVLIFDEMSMIRSDYMEMMHKICQAVKQNDKPFGGLKVILIGDMFQLPPIVTDDAVETYLVKEYGGIYFFNSHVIQDNKSSIKYFELNTSIRHQNDRDFENILDKIRGGCDVDDAISVLRKINARVFPQWAIPNDDNIIALASSNDEVLQINHNKLQTFGGVCSYFPAEISIKHINDDSYQTVFGSDKRAAISECDEIVIPSAYEKELILKPGARVMFTSSKKMCYNNGSKGTVISVDSDKILVKTDEGGTYAVERSDVYRYKMSYDDVKHKLQRLIPYIQKTTQFPLKLAYAITIHKSQAQTYDKVYVDLNSPLFANGQLYVALSRAKTMDGLYLTHPVALSDIRVDKEILHFLHYFNDTYPDRRFYSESAPNYAKMSYLKDVISYRLNNCAIKRGIDNAVELCSILLDHKFYDYAFLELKRVIRLIKSQYFIGEVSFENDSAKCDSADEFEEYLQETIMVCDSISSKNKRLIVVDQYH